MILAMCIFYCSNSVTVNRKNYLKFIENACFWDGVYLD